MKLPQLLSVFMLGGFLSACGPSYFLTMKPTAADTIWYEGREMMLQEQDSMLVQMSFVRYEGRELVFEAVVENGSSQPILVAPEQFYYQPVVTQAATAGTATNVPGRVAAIDPEQRMQQLETQLAYESKEATKVSFGELLTTLSHITENVASIKKEETEKEIDEREERQQSERDYYTNHRIDHSIAADQVRYTKEEVEQRLLRKNTLPPGQYIRGYVYFPRTDAADVIRVVVPVNEQQPATFDFTQDRTKQ
ncbi:hypothetical protein F1C16_03790 [Hymenobacter sp. NBH84]|uniref:hypothetical protein n=1 Tax=Hymenobacter sp. NBH84 TaxID=2596915 RepID=UPI00162A432C|nr:hypothetical protein [Hymenobacter sp. NBH84]QNE38737.1 hypothetical protein F1C16_03790 [Hymenobacter sp. NBH84]